MLSQIARRHVARRPNLGCSRCNSEDIKKSSAGQWSAWPTTSEIPTATRPDTSSSGSGTGAAACSSRMNPTTMLIAPELFPLPRQRITACLEGKYCRRV